MATGNADRIRVELEKAALSLEERYPGYRESLVSAAMDCLAITAEHDDRKTNINQRFDACLDTLGKCIVAESTEAKG